MSEITNKNTQVKIIGVGSPAGLDELGWRLVQTISELARFEGIYCLALRDPGMLPSELLEAKRVVLLDAGMWAVGEVRTISFNELAAEAQVSSHALSISDAVQLGLHLNPELRVGLIGVGIIGGGTSLEPLLDEVMPEVIALLQKELRMP